jgi:hypothetical protein
MPDVDFGVLVLVPRETAESPWREMLASWHRDLRNGHPCLFCHFSAWSESRQPSHFVALRDQIAPLSPICTDCANRFSDREALMDVAAPLAAKSRLWPNVGAHRVAVG